MCRNVDDDLDFRSSNNSYVENIISTTTSKEQRKDAAISSAEIVELELFTKPAVCKLLTITSSSKSSSVWREVEPNTNIRHHNILQQRAVRLWGCMFAWSSEKNQLRYGKIRILPALVLYGDTSVNDATYILHWCQHNLKMNSLQHPVFYHIRMQSPHSKSSADLKDLPAYVD